MEWHSTIFNLTSHVRVNCSSADHLARHFNCSTTDTHAMVDCLRQQDAKELDDTFYRAYGNDTGGYYLGPVVDGIIIPQVSFNG